MTLGISTTENVRDKYVELINGVKDAGGQIDTVGLQGHMWTFELPSDNDIKETLEYIHTKTGLPLHITEFDISYDNSIHGGGKIDPQRPFITHDSKEYENWFAYQTFAYTHFAELCDGIDYVQELTFWGCVDEDVEWERSGIGLFDNNMKPKPAFKALSHLLK